jgi:D-beta-D-heptose 7-phosphate kinase/D-beta-D-heptose 1-phosphate adenosyltransferase
MRVLIVGESCLDEYVYGYCDRVCPEASALCFRDINKKNHTLGMASNVLNNIQYIRPNYLVDIITNKKSIIKRRFIDARYNTIVFRQDISDQCERINVKKYNYQNYDTIIISDYCKGFLEEEDIEYIIKKKNKACISFIDTKKKISGFVYGIDFLKINDREFKENIDDLNNIKNLCQIIVTKGELGALHIDKESQTLYKTKKIDIRDVCGAGDTFMAAFSIRYVETKNIKSSIHYANRCSGSVIKKFGTAVP